MVCHKGTENSTNQKKLMLQFQGISSPNSLIILCLAYYKPDNSLRSDNLLYNIAQNIQRKGLLMPFHRRIRSFWFVLFSCTRIDVSFL